MTYPVPTMSPKEYTVDPTDVQGSDIRHTSEPDDHDVTRARCVCHTTSNRLAGRVKGMWGRCVREEDLRL